ncbi:hypothetical protein D0C36_13675 [Mucilaginibacter conchicola]|uniref:DUF1080 domain-containing protein n=1 Tax=Mucilaginibacter conchicola TaxID=2303333 RepID=A0A372NTM5_9SPHI|nr:hypothetical protein [Mucilaginibacter conchicola]RFZ92472.1 hypothetical protein D0C36_13675 [Mucilaginibacter conchicola]
MKLFRPLTLLALVIACAFTSCKKDKIDPESAKLLLNSQFDKVDPAWGTGENDYSKRTVANGYYIVQNKDQDSYYFSYTDPIFGSNTDNIGVEAKLKLTGGNADYSTFGGISHNYLPGNNTMDVFGFYNNGTFEIFHYDENNFGTVYHSDNSPAVKINDFNTLRIELRGGTYHYYINGTEVFSRKAGNVKFDQLGIYIDPATTATVDYYKAFKL